MIDNRLDSFDRNEQKKNEMINNNNNKKVWAFVTLKINY